MGFESLESRQLLATAAVTHLFRDDDYSIAGTFKYNLTQSDYKDSIPSGQYSGTGHVFWQSPTIGQATFEGTATGSGSDQVLFGGIWRNCSSYTIRDQGTMELAIDAAQKKMTVDSSQPTSTVYTSYTDRTGGFCPAGDPLSVYFGGVWSKYLGTFDAGAHTASITYADASVGVTVTSPAAPVTWANTANTDFAISVAARNGAPTIPDDWIQLPPGDLVPDSTVLDAKHGGVEITVQVTGKPVKAPVAGPAVPVGNLQLAWASAQTVGATLETIAIDSTDGVLGVFWNSDQTQAVIDNLPVAPSWARFVKVTVTAAGFTETNVANNSAFLPIDQFDAQDGSTANHSEDELLDNFGGSVLGPADAARYPDVAVLAYATLSRLGAPVFVADARGEFAYDPTTTPALQALAQGETVDDFIDFLAIENGTFVDDATHRVTVVGVNDLPFPGDDFATTRENVVLEIASSLWLANDFDVDHGDSVRFLDVESTSLYGAAVTLRDDGTVLYDPTLVEAIRSMTSGESLQDSLAYRIVDNSNAEAWGVVMITVSGTNDPPEVLPIEPVVVAVGESTGATIVRVRDWETAPDLLAVLVSSQASPLLDPEDIAVSGTGDARTVTLTPNPGQTGRARLTAQVSTPAPESALGTRDFYLIVGTATDDDWDGVPNSIEAAGPGTGDANADGAADRLQAHVASFRSHADDLWLRVESPSSAALSNIAAGALPTAAGVASGASFPWGGFAYEVALAPGGKTTLKFASDSTKTLNSYYQWVATPGGQPGDVTWQWLMWNGRDGARVFSDHVELTVQDGGRGDADGLVNGLIVGAAAPAKTTFPWHNPQLAEDGNNDTRVESLDALLIINYLNSSLPNNLPDVVLTGQVFPFFLDVFPDNLITSRDALQTINRLNGIDGSAEGEAPLPRVSSNMDAGDGSGANWTEWIDAARASSGPSSPARPGAHKTPAAAPYWDGAVPTKVLDETIVALIAERGASRSRQTTDSLFGDWTEAVGDSLSE